MKNIGKYELQRTEMASKPHRSGQKLTNTNPRWREKPVGMWISCHLAGRLPEATGQHRHLEEHSVLSGELVELGCKRGAEGRAGSRRLRLGFSPLWGAGQGISLSFGKMKNLSCFKHVDQLATFHTCHTHFTT